MNKNKTLTLVLDDKEFIIPQPSNHESIEYSRGYFAALSAIINAYKNLKLP